MVKAFLRATLNHFGKNFKFREALKNANCLSVASFRILAERNLKSEMSRLSEQNMLLPYEITKCVNPGPGFAHVTFSLARKCIYLSNEKVSMRSGGSHFPFTSVSPSLVFSMI
jgi:hypothetical protein